MSDRPFALQANGLRKTYRLGDEVIPALDMFHLMNPP